MTSVAEKKYSLPSEDKKAQYLLGKILADGLSQNELNAAYDDVSKDYDQVQERIIFFQNEINLRENQKIKSNNKYFFRNIKRNIFTGEFTKYYNF